MSGPEPTASFDTALAHDARLLATDPALAGAQATEIPGVVADHPMALLLLGAAHAAQGQADQAVQILDRLARAQPNWARAAASRGTTPS